MRCVLLRTQQNHLQNHLKKAPVLIAKMSLDGTQVLEWDVTLEKYKSGY